MDTLIYPNHRDAFSTSNYSEPTSDMYNNPVWTAIWDEIKNWKVQFPSEPNDVISTNEKHVTAIFMAINKYLSEYKEENYDEETIVEYTHEDEHVFTIV